ncbi:MAG: hypothetical protein ACODAG_04800 [Myxococcota bacterium]
MSDVDEGTHAIDLHVVVMGSATETLLSNLAHAEREGGDVRMRLGTVQGWTPTLHFHAFGHDPWSGDGADGERLAEVVPKMDALILTDGHGHGYSSNAVEHLTRLLKPAKIGVPAAVFGSAVLAQEWASQANRPPVHQAESDPDRAMEVVKAIAKPMLKALQAR